MTIEPTYSDDRVTLHHGDCLDVLRTLSDASVDSVVTDPPYGLGFMGREWDALPPGRPWAEQCLRVLKPGGHLIAFGGTRTWHRLAVAVEDAGFEIRDSIAWLYGSGFPKSLDVSKAIDKAAGVEFAASPASGVGFMTAEGKDGWNVTRNRLTRAGEQTEEAGAWEGWGTALKPAFEPCVVARKPLAGTVAANVLAHGTGALNIDACRIATADSLGGGSSSRGQIMKDGWHRPWMNDPEAVAANAERSRASVARSEELGRWPANVVLDVDQAAELDAQAGHLASGTMRKGTERQPRAGGTIYGADGRSFVPSDTYGDSGGASRFFYVAKADASERVRVDGVAHPTVKPLSLMRWLVRLVTPPDGTVLEPFAGSGTTVEACLLEGFRCVAIEREAEYLPLIRQRLNRRRDPVAAVLAAGVEDSGLFDLLDPGTEAAS